jgi:hypothetical protein
VEGSGLWSRTFTKAVSFVNPTEKSVQATLPVGDAFVDLYGKSVTGPELSMPPVTAITLLKVSQRRQVKSDDDGAAALSGGLNGTINIGNSTQLFVDDFIVASMANLSRTMNRPVTDRQIIAADAPWEQGFTIGIIGTSVVLEDTGVIRVWYQLRNASLGHERCGHTGQPPCRGAAGVPQPNYHKGPILTALAESHDGGRTFVKPLLHHYTLRGSTANNIIGRVYPAVRHDWGKIVMNTTNIDSIFVDPTVPVDSARRYRGVSGNLPFYSRDGVNWTAEQYRWDADATSLFVGDWGTTGFDTQPVVFWDPPCQCYSYYTRFKNEPPRPAPWFRMVRRLRARSLDANAGRGEWTNRSACEREPAMCQRIVMRADAVDNASHTMGAEWKIPPLDYYGATPWYVDLGGGFGLYMMAAVRFWHFGGNYPGPGTYDVALATSRDGADFQFLGGRAAWLRPNDDGHAGSRNVWLAAPGPIAVGEEELYIVTRGNFAEGTAFPISAGASHGWECVITLGRMRRHGLVSLDAPFSVAAEAATLVTRPLTFRGERLLLNLEAAGGGSAYLEVYAAGATTSNESLALMKAMPLVASGVALEVSWKDPLRHIWNATAIAELAGLPIVLKVTMQDCKLYSLRFV